MRGSLALLDSAPPRGDDSDLGGVQFLIQLMAAMGAAESRALAFGAAVFVIFRAIVSLTFVVPGFHFWESDLVVMFCYPIQQVVIVCGATAFAVASRQKRTFHSRLQGKSVKTGNLRQLPVTLITKCRSETVFWCIFGSKTARSTRFQPQGPTKSAKIRGIYLRFSPNLFLDESPICLFRAANESKTSGWWAD